MSAQTDRLKLPLLAIAQAQKEMTHNEALTIVDVLAQPVVEAVGMSAVPTAPLPGQCWIVGATAAGAWAGQAGAIAAWTGGGWRFVAPRDGMHLWSLADGCMVRRAGSAWLIGQATATSLTIGGKQIVGAQQPAIAMPAGGGTIDGEARTTLNAILTALKNHGLIATA